MDLEAFELVLLRRPCPPGTMSRPGRVVRLPW
jgi:hypothetical protein